MLKAIETENIIKNIVKEVVRECALKGVKTSDSLAAFLIKLLVINPEYGFNSEHHRLLNRSDVALLVALCVAKLSESNSPALASIKMQVYFDNHYISQRKLIEEHRGGMKRRSAALLKEVLDLNPKTPEEADRLYRRLAILLVVLTGLGNPSNIAVFKEATAGLHSVFPISELTPFASLTRKAKELQITELSQIVAGIRIFNRDCQKGGEGIEDLPYLLPKTIETTQDTLENNLQKLMRKINILTTAVETVIKNKVKEKSSSYSSNAMRKVSEYSTSFALSDQISTGIMDEKVVDNQQYKDKPTPEEENLVKDSLATSRLLEVYIRKLLTKMTVAKLNLTEMLERLRARLTHLHSTVRHRTAIPVELVYPQFIELADIWLGLQDVSVFLNSFNKLAWSLQSFCTLMEHIPAEVMSMLVDENEVMNDAERLQATTGEHLDPKRMRCKFLPPSMVASMKHIPLEYLGFCPWALVIGQGVLLPGNPNMGVCIWKDKYYAFSSVDAAAEWSRDPKIFIHEVFKLVRTKPELIGLLHLQEEMDAIRVRGELPERDTGIPVECRDIEVQTELHPVPTHIDPDYTWNEWEYRRRSIKLANLAKCKTTSMQTDLSNFRAGVAVQASPDKSKSCQTIRDNATNVPTLQNFIYGLRGQTDLRKCHVISLTQPVADIAISKDECEQTTEGST